MKVSRVRFPDRRRGLVHVRGRLQLSTGTPAIDVSFRREDLVAAMRAAPRSAHLVQLAASVFCELSRVSWELEFHRPGSPWHTPEDGALPSALKRRRLTIDGYYVDDLETGKPGFSFTVRISKVDMKLVADELTADPRGSRRVLTEIEILFADRTLLAAASGALRPRGARARASDLLASVRWALLEAEQLCKVAQADDTLRARVKAVLGEDFAPRRWRENAVLLVSRAFRPAWTRYHVKLLDARAEGDAGDVYKTLLPARRRRALLAAFQQGAPALGGWVHSRWPERLLGPEGQAARDFDLS